MPDGCQKGVYGIYIIVLYVYSVLYNSIDILCICFLYIYIVTYRYVVT